MSDAKTLITVTRTDGARHALLLDASASLADTREILFKHGYMRPHDLFLTAAKAAIEASDEGEVPLSAVVADGVLLLGVFAPVSPIIDPKDGIARYNNLNADERNAIFTNVQIFRGLAATGDGFQKTFRDVYAWADGSSPRANMPTTNTQLTSSFSFSKVTRDLNLFSSQSASVSLSTPYGSGEAEYKTEKSKTTSSSAVDEYLVTRYIVRKVSLQVDPSSLRVSNEFKSAVKSAVTDRDRSIQAYYDLIKVLNTWGYYIPLEFTLGGVIYASDHTKISDYGEAEKNKQEFTGSFKAAFKGIGGGAAYSQASGSEATTANSKKFTNTSLQMVGGQAGLEKDYPAWATSLAGAVNWALADVTKMHPTLVLLAGTPEGNAVLGTAINAIERFCTHPNAADAQPYLDMNGYNTVIQTLINPFF